MRRSQYSINDFFPHWYNFCTSGYQTFCILSSLYLADFFWQYLYSDFLLLYFWCQVRSKVDSCQKLKFLTAYEASVSCKRPIFYGGHGDILHAQYFVCSMNFMFFSPNLYSMVDIRTSLSKDDDPSITSLGDELWQTS